MKFRTLLLGVIITLILCVNLVKSEIYSTKELNSEYIYTGNENGYITKYSSNLSIINTSLQRNPIQDLTIDDEFIYVFGNNELSKHYKSNLSLISNISVLRSYGNGIKVDEEFIYLTGRGDGIITSSQAYISKHYKSNLSFVSKSDYLGGSINSIQLSDLTNYLYTIRILNKSNLNQITSEGFGSAISTIDEDYTYFGSWGTIYKYDIYLYGTPSLIYGVHNTSNYFLSIDNDEDYIYTTQKYNSLYYIKKIDKEDYSLSNSVEILEGGLLKIKVDKNYLYLTRENNISKYYKENLTFINSSEIQSSEIQDIVTDSIIPTINLSYPTSLIDYAKVNDTLELNFTATDSNLDSVWYDYNGSYLNNLTYSSGNQFNIPKGEEGYITYKYFNYTGGGKTIVNQDVSSCSNLTIIFNQTGGLVTYYGNILCDGVLLTQIYSYHTTGNEAFWIAVNNGVFNKLITGATSGVDILENITLTNSKEVIIYANDTAGNLASEVFSWDYKVFETGREYDSTINSGQIGDFILNVTLKEGYDLTSAILNYNGTEYSGNIYSSGQNRRIVSSFEIPIFTADTNISFYWTLNVSGTEIILSENTQTINAILLDNCAVYTNRLFNISLFDERTKNSLRGDIELEYQLLNVPSYNLINQQLISVTNVSNVQICSENNLSGEDMVYSAVIRYTSEEYVSELYHIQRADIGDSVQSLNLFDLETNHSTEFKIIYQDDDYTFVEGAIIQLQRSYISEGIYEIVEAPITSNEGTAVVHIDLDTNKYQVTIVKNGEVLDFFPNLVFSCESILTGECSQKLLGAINPQNDINLDTLKDFIYSDPSILNETISVSFSVPSGSPSLVQLSMVQKDQFGNKTLCNQTITSSAGSLECEFSDTIGDSFLDVSISKNGELISQSTYIIPKDSGMDFLGNNFFIVMILMLSLVGMAFTSPEWIIVNGVMTMLISGALWLINGVNFVMGLGALMWLVITAGILIFKLAKQEDR